MRNGSKKDKLYFAIPITDANNMHICTATTINKFILIIIADCICEYEHDPEFRSKIFVEFEYSHLFIDYLKTHPDYQCDSFNFNIGIIRVSHLPIFKQYIIYRKYQVHKYVPAAYEQMAPAVSAGRFRHIQNVMNQAQTYGKQTVLTHQ